MDYPIAIDPGLNLDLDDLAAAWNAAPESRVLAQARTLPRKPRALAQS